MKCRILRWRECIECDGIEEIQRDCRVRSWLASSEDGEQRGQVGWLAALFKQATIGDCNISAPSMFNFTVREEWNGECVGEGEVEQLE